MSGAGRGERAGWDGLIVLCATTEYGGIRMGDWHLASQLSRLGPVLFVDPPASSLAGLRRRGRPGPPARPSLSVIRPGLARLTPVVQPFPARRGTVGVTTALTRGYLRWATSRLAASVTAVISGWPVFPVFGSCSERVSVYWAKDDYVGGAGLLGLDPHLTGARERAVAGRADLIVAANPLVAGLWRQRGLDPLLIPFGTDAAAFRGVDQAGRPDDVRLPAPVAGFIGHINDRLDLALLEEIAARGRSLLLVGPADPRFEPRRFAALTAAPNVTWVGPRPAAALPGYLRVIDVGLVPYRDSAFNRGSFPLKTLEYLAAGRAVVSTDLPATRWLATDLVRIAAGPASFADQVDLAAAGGRDPADVALRRQFADAHSWQRRAAQVHAAITACCAATGKTTTGYREFN